MVVEDYSTRDEAMPRWMIAVDSSSIVSSKEDWLPSKGPAEK